MSETEELPWYRAECLAQNADRATELLWRLDAGGVEVHDQTTYMEGAEVVPVPDGMTRLVAYFQTDDAEAIERALTESLPHATGSLVGFLAFTDTSWMLKWKEYFSPRQLSPRATVGPPWETFAPPVEGGLAIVIDPGMAFGTGTHETTQLCAAALDDLLADDPPQTLLDVGCGSAILSILAARLGVPRVVGVDVEAEAIESAKNNLPLNGLTDDDVALSTTPLADVEGVYDIVVANILLHILTALKDELRAHTRPGGVLLLSGIGTHQEAQAIETFNAPGWTLQNTRRDGEWIALRYVRDEEEG